MKRLLSITLCTVAALAPIAYGAFSHSYDSSYKPKFISGLSDAGHWFVGIGGGIDWASLGNKNQQLDTLNGTPIINDTFQMKALNSSGMFDASVGYRFKTNSIKSLSLFFEYDNFSKISGTGTRFDLGNTNPSLGGINPYTYNLQRKAFLLDAKADLMQWHKVMPYVEAGLGISQNSFSNYVNNDQNFPMYPFPNQTNSQMSYVLGLGLDMRATQHLLFSMGYRFGYWGDMKSGSITQAAPAGSGPLPTPIHFVNAIYSNQASFKASYLF